MRKFFTGIALLSLTMTAFAAQRTVEEAAAIAANFSNTQAQASGIRRAPRQAADMRLVHQVAKPNSSEAALYVFNKPEGGWVIISADDIARTVLAYSDESTFDSSNANSAYFLDYYAERIAKAYRLPDEEKNDHTRKKDVEPYQFHTITPLLGTGANAIQWNQTPPYNNMCPIDHADDSRSYTGCVATAGAQIMYFWRYPEHGMGGRTYSWKSGGGGFGTENVDFSAATYDWDNMLPQYHNGQYTQAQADAVALLMYHAGVSAYMAYGGDIVGGSGSGGVQMAQALHENFGYTLATRYTGWDKRDTLDKEKAYDIELLAGRPIMMGGNGHAFICDGADGTGRYHINWGWGGGSDGYYYLFALDPNDQGVGAATDGVGYSKGMDCFFGLRPEEESDRIHVTDIALNKSSLSMKISEQYHLKATIKPDTATNKGIHWTSSNEDVATVDYNGWVIARSAGTATITVIACDGSLKATCQITVANEYPGSGSLMELGPISPSHEFTWNDEKGRYESHLSLGGGYPYLIVKLPHAKDSTITGRYDMGNEAAYIWPTADQPNLEFYAETGWMNIACIDATTGTYQLDGYFTDPEGNGYVFQFTTAITLSNEGMTLADKTGDNMINTIVATFQSMGETCSSTVASDGKLILPTRKPLNCSDLTFIGWTKEDNYNSSIAPTLAQNGDPITTNTTYHAVFAHPDGSKDKYTEVASIDFAATGTANNDSAWYFDKYGIAHDGYTDPTELVASSDNIHITGGAWIRSGRQGLKVGAYHSDNASNVTTEYNRKKNKQGYIKLEMDHGAIISKVVVSSEKTTSHDKGRLMVYINDVCSQSAIVYGDNVEYIHNEPVSTKSLSLATNGRAVYIKSVKVYSGGLGYDYYTTTACEVPTTPTAIENSLQNDSKWTKTIENGMLYIIRDGKKYNVLGLNIQ